MAMWRDKIGCVCKTRAVCLGSDLSFVLSFSGSLEREMLLNVQLQAIILLSMQHVALLLSSCPVIAFT